MNITRDSINTFFKSQSNKDLIDCIKEDTIFLGKVGRGKTTIVQEIGKIRKEQNGQSQTIIEASYIVEQTGLETNSLQLLKSTGYHPNLVIDNLNGAGEIKHFGVAKDMIEDIIKHRLDKKLEAIKILHRAKSDGETLKGNTKYNNEIWWAKTTNTIITNLTLTELKGVFSEPTWNRLSAMINNSVYVIERVDSFRNDG